MPMLFNSKEQQIFLAFLSAALFALAGLIEIVVGAARIYSATASNASHQGASSLAVGGLLVAVGGLLSVIAAKWKKEATTELD